MDFIDGLPASKGLSVVFTIVDRFTKFANFFALSHHYTIVQVTEVFFNGVFKLHGLTKTIVSDKDVVFTRKFWKELFHMQGSNLTFSSAYHPQLDGQSKAVNKAIEAYL